MALCASQAEKTNRTEAAVCVSGQQGVSECSPPLFSGVKTPEGLSAPGAAIYHQSGKSRATSLAGAVETQDSLTHTNRCEGKHTYRCATADVRV